MRDWTIIWECFIIILLQIWEEEGVLWCQEVMTRECVRADLTRTTTKLQNKLRQQSAR